MLIICDVYDSLRAHLLDKTIGFKLRVYFELA